MKSSVLTLCVYNGTIFLCYKRAIAIYYRGVFMLKGAVVIGQSGGPTAAINATLAGVIKGALEDKTGSVTKVYGMRNGIEGFLSEDIIDLS